MDNKQFREFDKKFYQVLKSATKARKIKLSAEHDIYKKAGPYFYHTFYALHDVDNGKAIFSLDITVKYHRFDELQFSILCPGDSLKFTDKIRANSGALCDATFPRIIQEFNCDGSDESIAILCEDLLDFLEKYYSDFLEMVELEYGDLDGYYIAHREDNPRLAGLAYLDKGNYDGAIDCFSSPNMDGENNKWIVHPETSDQIKRAKANGYLPQSHLDRWLQNAFVQKTGQEKYGSGQGSVSRSRKEQFIDYAIALKNGLKWTSDMAMFGLLDKER